QVAVWNRHSATMETFVAAHPGPNLLGARTLAELVQALARPRRVLLMISPGPPIDETIAHLQPLLAHGDVVIDGGNSWFKDTQRREATLAAAGLLFIGSGVSGGEEGARSGPSLMPGGPRVAYEAVRRLFEAIAAKTRFGPCVGWMGPDGAGHFVKMVHNGIEYGVMQLIAETYDVLRTELRLSNDESAAVFARWNRGPLESFLVELTARVLRVRDEDGGHLVDQVEDAAAQKGTGRWTNEIALELAVPVPTIAAALDARVLSSMRAERLAAARRLPRPAARRWSGAPRSWIAALEDALLGGAICAYAQGLALIRAASAAYGWHVDLPEVARVWTGGCIIRARLLVRIMAAFRRQPDLPNLLVDPAIARELARVERRWRAVVAEAARTGVPAGAMAASLAYLDTYRAARLPQNLTQAQRDAFGAHTYRRLDRPDAGPQHSSWALPVERPTRRRRR
ncbi:MAG TPA: decarboxylating NADP(+)-dependent phosphogluconate dehydrogenase, partial [Candidatus Binatia bacterium]|nr:decarboxylating NADP(+)-dependent phosphogluconate dehydrogenase [Candidatus Binatia bacterium]